MAEMEPIPPIERRYGIAGIGNERRGKKGAFDDTLEKEGGDPQGGKKKDEPLQPKPPPLRKDPEDGDGPVHVDVVV